MKLLIYSICMLLWVLAVALAPAVVLVAELRYLGVM